LNLRGWFAGSAVQHAFRCLTAAAVCCSTRLLGASTLGVLRWSGFDWSGNNIRSYIKHLSVASYGCRVRLSRAHARRFSVLLGIVSTSRHAHAYILSRARRWRAVSGCWYLGSFHAGVVGRVASRRLVHMCWCRWMTRGTGVARIYINHRALPAALQTASCPSADRCTGRRSNSRTLLDVLALESFLGVLRWSGFEWSGNNIRSYIKQLSMSSYGCRVKRVRLSRARRRTIPNINIRIYTSKDV
jgi:hypothetical protein